MDSSAEEVLLESCCFLWNYYQEQIKRKRNRTWVREILKKKKKREFTIIYCRRYMSMIENHISSKLSTAKTAQLFPKPFLPSLSLFVSLIIFFIKARILRQLLSQAFIILYIFSSFSFVFINALLASAQA